MGLRRWGSLIVAWGVAAATGCLFLAAGPATAAPKCAEPGVLMPDVGWAQKMLGNEAVGPFARGAGRTIAVLDSGVDRNHPQLRGKVLEGFDAVAGNGRADNDCLGTGTQVAGVIAARQVSGVGLAGLAPEAKILPVRVIAERGSAGAVTTPAVLAKGINAAVDRGADILAVSVISYEDSPELQGAVKAALGKGVIVVAAVGDLGDANGANPTPYPADHDDVLGIAAIDEAGVRWTKSQYGDYVDLAAPGADVITTQAGGNMVRATGTGVATGFAAAAVALVRDERGADVPADTIRNILAGTAVAAGPAHEYGSGLVNPYAAVNEQLAEAGPTRLPAMVRPPEPGTSIWAASRDLALLGTVIGLVAVMLVAAVAISLPRGRRRFWRPALAAPPPEVDEPEEPGPPVQLFDERTAAR